MKTQMNIMAVCFLLASVLMVPQAANAVTPPLVGPCTNASLTGYSFAYELRGDAVPIPTPIPHVTEDIIVTTQVGRFHFNGDGTANDSFSNVVDGLPWNTDEASVDYYQLSSDCTTITMTVHNWYAVYENGLLAAAGILYPCAHITAKFAPTPILLGALAYGKGGTTLNTKVLLADASLSCTDSSSVKLVKLKGVDATYTLTGTMTQQ